MTKLGFISAVAKEADIPEATVRKVLNAQEQVVLDCLLSGDGESVSIPGIGRIHRKIRCSKKVYIPALKGKKFVPEHYVAKIVFSESIKESLKEISERRLNRRR